MAQHRRRWRIGPLTLAAIVLATVGAVGVWFGSTSHAGLADPAQLLQCQGGNVEVSELVHSVDGTADSATPEQIVDRWAAGLAVHGGARTVAREAGVSKRTEFRSDDQAQISMVSAAGQVRAVVTMTRTPQLGWHLEVIHECA
jgi:hypothetical protein